VIFPNTPFRMNFEIELDLNFGFQNFNRLEVKN